MESEAAITDIKSTEQSNRQSNQNLSPDARANWDKIIADWEASGLSAISFCKEHNIKHHRFVYFRAKRSKNINNSKRMLPIEVSRSESATQSTSAFILLLQTGAKLSIPQHYEEGALKKLLSLLGVSPC